MKPLATSPLLFCDYNGSAPLDPIVKDFLLERLESPLFANPNGLYAYGLELNQRIETCRETIAELIGIDPHQIVFTSGSSESVMTYLMMVANKVWQQDGIRPLKILSSMIEHAGIDLWLKQGPWVTGMPPVIDWLQPNEQGLVSEKETLNLLEHSKKKNTPYDLVIFMTANNETGVIQPFEKVAEWCAAHEVALLTDTTQSLGKLSHPWGGVNGLQFACGSSHKWGAPLGSGLMILGPKQTGLSGVIRGHQEFHKRGGTQNYLGIETMTAALLNRFQEWRQGAWEKVKKEKLFFEASLKEKFPHSVILGDQVERLPNTTLWGVPGIHGQALQIELEAQNIFVTTSSACSDNEPHTSHILRSMGINDQLGRSVIRISVGAEMTSEHYHHLINCISTAVAKLSK